MDDLEAVYNLNRDKALGVLSAAGNLIIFTVVTIISVFIPLAFTLSQNYPDLMILFGYLMVFSPIVLFPIFAFFLLKYREYKNEYRIALIKSIVKNYFRLAGANPNPPDSETICKEIVRITGNNTDEVMEMLIKIYPPPKIIPVITK
ncbi:MAG: hypothetical protein O8C61_09070 [Candidatus Methanoperedens sp.]|nr:hypothetical protein [Candidatus Methanoperedens sp.]